MRPKAAETLVRPGKAETAVGPDKAETVRPGKAGWMKVGYGRLWFLWRKD